MQPDKKQAQRKARLWRKVHHTARPPGVPPALWEGQLRAAFRELGVHGPIERLTRFPERLGLTTNQVGRGWRNEALAARAALDRSQRRR